MSIIPNPSKDLIRFESSNLRVADALLAKFYNGKGGLIKEIETTFGQSIDISDFNYGIYLVHLEVNGVLIATKKLIKL